MTCCMWQVLDVLHVICTRLRPGHLSVCVGDGSRCSEEIVKNLEPHLWMRLLLLFLLTVALKGTIQDFVVSSLHHKCLQHIHSFPDPQLLAAMLDLVGCIIILMIIIILTVAWKGTVQDFVQFPHCANNIYALVAGAKPCANHVQHIEHLSCATCRVPLGRKGQFSY